MFTINKSGDGFNLLHQFITGGGPTATLLEASDGKLYGTTLLDNASIFYPGVGAPVGSIFRLNKDGTGYEVLHNFSADTPQDICDPTGPLVEGPDGAIYGTARQGGEGLGGAVFKLNKDGSNFEVVQAFIDSSTWISALGLRPESGLFRYPTAPSSELLTLAAIVAMARCSA